jgi:hypothetical protein
MYRNINSLTIKCNLICALRTFVNKNPNIYIYIYTDWISLDCGLFVFTSLMTQLKTQLDKPSLATLTTLQSEISVPSGSPLIASIQTFVLPSAMTFKVAPSY